MKINRYATILGNIAVVTFVLSLIVGYLGRLLINLPESNPWKSFSFLALDLSGYFELIAILTFVAWLLSRSILSGMEALLGQLRPQELAAAPLGTQPQYDYRTTTPGEWFIGDDGQQYQIAMTPPMLESPSYPYLTATTGLRRSFTTEEYERYLSAHYQ